VLERSLAELALDAANGDSYLALDLVVRLIQCGVLVIDERTWTIKPAETATSKARTSTRNSEQTGRSEEEVPLQVFLAA